MSGEYPVRIAVVGAGCRGAGYAKYVLNNPHLAKIVAVAEPREFHRNKFAKEHSIPEANVFKGWEELAAVKENVADAVIIATQDSMHLNPAVAFAKKGYHILLEKPMATDEESCRKIAAVAIEKGVHFAICHVMRYTDYTQKLKQIIDSGRIGEIVSLQLLEPVGYWHMAHSYVRGNWRNEKESSFMLLAKSCHDLDWIRYIIGNPCLRVSSFGNLKHFTKENRPLGASDRCLTCSVEAECPYSAKKIYLGRVENGENEWPVDILTSDTTYEGVTKALETGPYGRCVYCCDNDVVDHQVVNMQFEEGQTATFTMTGFNESAGRKVRIFGTKGEIEGNDDQIRIFDFLSDKTEVIEISAGSNINDAHGGGDYGLMKSFIETIAHNDPSLNVSSPEEALETHLMVFAAERSRLENRIVSVQELQNCLVCK